MDCHTVHQDPANETHVLSASHYSKQSPRAESDRARCFTPVFQYQRHFDGYVEMSEEDAALFWRVDTPIDPVSGKESADPVLDSTEATPVKGLCLETMTLPTSVRATSAPAVDCSPGKVALAETAQDTKPAVQSQ